MEILRNVGNQIIADSFTRALLVAAFTALALEQFEGILPDGVTLPEDAEYLISFEPKSGRRVSSVDCRFAGGDPRDNGASRTVTNHLPPPVWKPKNLTSTR